MLTAVEEIVDRISKLPEAQRAVLEARLAELDEEAWKREADKARTTAKAQGIDQDAIDRAVESLRHPKRPPYSASGSDCRS